MDFANLVADAYKEPGRSEVLRLIPQLSSDERDQLPHELLRRGDNDLQRRPQFHLLAFACLEQVMPPETAIRIAIAERVQQLIPPHSVKEAESLARAGILAVKPLAHYLQSIGGESYWEAVTGMSRFAGYCLRALALTRTDAALEAIASFTGPVGLAYSHPNYFEIEAAWRYFNQEAYACRVILPLFERKTDMVFNAML